MMKIGLIPARCINNDISFNLSQIIRFLEMASKENVDYIFFGESFLQGFDSLSWSYDIDKDIAVKRNSIIIRKIKHLSKKYGVGLGFGYFELAQASIYSSYLVVSPEGKELINYRRVSKGWKEYRKIDKRYKEGNSVKHFRIDSFDFTLALCGDLWDEETVSLFAKNQVFQTNIIWPVHVDFSLQAWSNEIKHYHKQALKFSRQVLLINNILEPHTHGGAFIFTESDYRSIAFDKEEILVTSM
ncbi:MAG: carbon-nitrogen hydrolase family protein [Candidatus Izemoplasmatales bacterium]